MSWWSFLLDPPCCRVIVLEDNDILHLARGTYAIYNLQRDDPSAKVASVSRALSRLDMEVRLRDLHSQLPCSVQFVTQILWRHALSHSFCTPSCR